MDVRAALPALSLVLVACAALVDTSGLTGNASPGPSDAAPSVDAPATVTDAATSAADAPPVTSTLGPSPCPGTFDFCDDFDTSSPDFVPPWGELFLSRGTVTYATDHRRSGLRSARCATRATPDTDNAAVMFRYFSVNTSRVRVGWDMFVSRIDPAGVLYLGRVEIGGKGIRVEGQGDMHFHYEAGDAVANVPTYKKNEWTRFEIDLGLSSFTVTLDGVVVVDAASIDPPLMAGGVSLSVGVYFGSSPSVGHEVFYDNVTVDYD